MLDAVCRAPAAMLLVGACAVSARAQTVDLTVDAPPALASAARRVQAIDRPTLAAALGRAGLPLPERIRVVLIASDDPRAAAMPEWIVGLARGTRNIVIFPERVGSYPYGSLESIVRHEIVHLALNTRARGVPLPRWFHEGVAVTVERGWGAREEIRLLLAALDRPSMADLRRLFASATHPDTSQAYLLAAALVDDVRERHGSEAPGAIAAAVASGMAFETAFLSVTGEPTEAVAARAWAGHLRVTRFLPIATGPSAVWSLILAVAVVAFVFTVRRRRERRRRWDEEAEEEEQEEAGDGEAPPDVR